MARAPKPGRMDLLPPPGMLPDGTLNVVGYDEDYKGEVPAEEDEGMTEAEKMQFEEAHRPRRRENG